MNQLINKLSHWVYSIWTRTIRWYHCNHGTERGASLGCEWTKLSMAEYCQVPTSQTAC